MTKRANALCWTKALTILGQSTQQPPGEHVSDGTKRVHTHTPVSCSFLQSSPHFGISHKA